LTICNTFLRFASGKSIEKKFQVLAGFWHPNEKLKMKTVVRLARRLVELSTHCYIEVLVPYIPYGKIMEGIFLPAIAWRLPEKRPPEMAPVKAANPAPTATGAATIWSEEFLLLGDDAYFWRGSKCVGAATWSCIGRPRLIFTRT
jgi:hypothetical protein